MGDSSIIDWRDLKIKKLNKTTRGIYGNAIYHAPIDNTYKFEGTVYIKQGGRYKPLPFKRAPSGFCNFIQRDDQFYPLLAEESEFPFPMPCPLPKVRTKSWSLVMWKFNIFAFVQKTYAVNGFIPSLAKIPLTIMNTGEYAVENLVLKNGTVVMGWRLYLSVVSI